MGQRVAVIGAGVVGLACATHLQMRGHDVTVYCRERYTDSRYRGVRVRYLPTIRHKYFDTVAHTFLSTLHLLVHCTDVALYCNAATALFTWLPRLVGIPVALNVDGLERHRRKWNRLARTWYLVSEWLATFCPNAIVTDARSIATYYERRYGKSSHFIPYGAPIGKVETTDAPRRLGLEPDRYFLYVSRMEPENNALLVRESFERVDTAVKLVLVGDSGVGKTGLGWRLAHGEFKEHASTHGQQFWPITQLGLKRKDGTECEAVLWDLAGQHVYRQIHSIFLENVAAALTGKKLPACANPVRSLVIRRGRAIASARVGGM